MPLPLFPDLPDPEPAAPDAAGAGLRGALARLVEAGLSSEVVLALHRGYPGCSVHVPKRVTADHPLARVLGLEGAEALCRLAGGDTLSVPKRRYAPTVLYALIRRDLDAGVHVHDICRRFDVCERTVWQVGGRG